MWCTPRRGTRAYNEVYKMMGKAPKTSKRGYSEREATPFEIQTRQTFTQSRMRQAVVSEPKKKRRVAPMLVTPTSELMPPPKVNVISQGKKKVTPLLVNEKTQKQKKTVTPIILGTNGERVASKADLVRGNPNDPFAAIVADPNRTPGQVRFQSDLEAMEDKFRELEKAGVTENFYQQRAQKTKKKTKMKTKAKKTKAKKN